MTNLDRRTIRRGKGGKALRISLFHTQSLTLPLVASFIASAVSHRGLHNPRLKREITLSGTPLCCLNCLLVRLFFLRYSSNVICV